MATISTLCMAHKSKPDAERQCGESGLPIATLG